MKHKLYLILAVALLFNTQLKAQSPHSINYQGVARNNAGEVLPNQAISLRLTFHMGSASGNIVYQETQSVETNQFGLFTIFIGTGSVVSGDFLTIAWGRTAYFLQVELDATGGSNFVTMGNTQVLSVPYSYYADSTSYSSTASTASTATSATYSDTALFARNANTAPSVWTTSGTAIYNNNTGPVGIGSMKPSDSTSLTVASNHKYGIWAESDSSSGNASVIYAKYSGTGDYNGTAVTGWSVPADNYGVGGIFTGGFIGVGGLVNGATAADSYYGSVNDASSTAASDVYGNLSEANGSGGISYGVAGVASDNSTGAAYGVVGQATSASGLGYGLYGMGNTVGAYGTANGAGNTFPELGTPYGSELRVVGMYGELDGTTANSGTYEDDGVLGVSTMSGNYHGVGVCGYGTNATGSDIGVFGMGQGLGTENYVIAVYGYEDPAQGGGGVGSYVADYAGYFIGNVDITGTLTAATKNFKIDDPLDPANKYLYHSCVESPDMMNIYNGNITTDANGDATVTLPEYFEAANIDFKYQLTVIGQFAQAIIATEISNNQFTIKTDKPNVKVSWMVTGVRNDPYAKNNPTVAEVPKQGVEKGHYIHPEYYGQPQSLSIANLISGDMNDAQNVASLKANNPVPAPKAPTFTGVGTVTTPVLNSNTAAPAATNSIGTTAPLQKGPVNLICPRFN